MRDQLGPLFYFHAPFFIIDLAVKIKKAVGFRNIAVHEYEKMDWSIVHSIRHKQLLDLKSFGKAIPEKVGDGLLK